MSRPTVIAIFIAAMVALIGAVDVLLFRGHFWARLLVNIGIALIFIGCYLRFLRAS